ncbi:hypothetical protein B296_00033007 [Ensete ventricosum]|uniref:Major facilitator superfamily (MFS) profile domain-containing protein n=1 Tax=Ensete ventricosum TaxID=4639 RepID=A0A426X9L0_ENSVE|nr:hypothetical protein B296_00033007 [Ensete ventricosum]
MGKGNDGQSREISDDREEWQASANDNGWRDAGDGSYTNGVEDGAWKEGEGNRKQQSDRGDDRKNYDGKSKMGRNVISAGGARELQRRVSTGRAPFPGLSGDTGGGGRETERTLAGKATADASPLSLSTQIQMLALRVVNEPLESISLDLGFTGNTLAEGLVVSMCLGGALIGCLFSGLISDGIGRRRSFQLSALPMIIGASLRWRVCFWVSTVPAAFLALCMEFCAESPHWLYKVIFCMIVR